MAEQQRLYSKIWAAESRGKFFKVHDNLNVNPKWRKIGLEIFQYEPKPNQSVRHSVDFDDFLYFSYLIRAGRIGIRDANGNVPTGYEKEFSDYKGSKSDKYSTGFEARILKVQRQTARVGTGTVYVISIENGPGELTTNGTGAVKMSTGGEKKSLNFPLSEKEALKMAAVVEQYMAAFMSQNFTAIQVAHDAWDKPSATQEVDYSGVSEEVAA